MSSGVDPVPIGTLTIDCSGMASYLLDKPPGSMVGKHSSQVGYREAALEVISNQANFGVHIGITANDITRLQQSNEQIAAIDAVLPAARKLVEMLEETRHVVDNGRHMHIHEIAALVDARCTSQQSSELLARYEKTREYRSSIAMRAAASRRRNAQAAERASDQASAPNTPVQLGVPTTVTGDTPTLPTI